MSAVRGNIRQLAIARQPFDGEGNLLCLACRNPIQHGDFWIEIRQHDEYDETRAWPSTPAAWVA